MTGVFVGKLFYQNTAKERILAELPENSPIRQRVVKENSKRKNNFLENDSIARRSSKVENEKDDKSNNENIGEEIENQNNKKYTTYEQLRRNYRKFQKSAEPFRTKTESNINHVTRKIKFNKYGDEIIEDD